MKNWEHFALINLKHVEQLEMHVLYIHLYISQ